MHFPSSRKAIFIFSVRWELYVLTAPKGGEGQGEERGQWEGGAGVGR